MPIISTRKTADVAAVVKAAREDAHRLQDDVSSTLNIPRGYIVELESGRDTLYINRLFRVLNELGVTMTLSYRGIDERP